MKMPKLEIACFNVESALVAEQSGADRIELCDGISEGGTTPSVDTIELVKNKIRIDLMVMIRPCGGNFVYSDPEFIQMKEDLLRIKKMGVNGFVFGILNNDGSINKKQNTELVKLSAPLACTFHRAFDAAADAFKALEDVIDCGFTAILTSGQKTSAGEGIDLLAQLVKQAGNRIIIMPGGGIRSSNMSVLKEKVDADFYHSSAIINDGTIADGGEIKLLKEKLM